MRLPKVLLREVQDPIARENFKGLVEFLMKIPILRGAFEFREFTFSSAGTFAPKHGLTFIPKDLIVTSVIGSGTVAWDYGSFNRDTLAVTTTGPCTVRAFVGAYSEDPNA